MKINRHGQAEPITHDHYLKIRKHTRSDRHRLLLDLAYYTGLRWATLLRLRRVDVFDRGNIPRSKIVCPPSTVKNGSTLEIPVHTDLEMLLKSASIDGDVDLLFPFTISAADKQFRRAIEKAGLSHLGYSTYSTRRGFITQLHRAGTGIKTIQKLTGHKSLVSLQRYIEVTDQELAIAIGGIGK